MVTLQEQQLQGQLMHQKRKWMQDRFMLAMWTMGAHQRSCSSTSRLEHGICIIHAMHPCTAGCPCLSPSFNLHQPDISSSPALHWSSTVYLDLWSKGQSHAITCGSVYHSSMHAHWQYDPCTFSLFFGLYMQSCGTVNRVTILTDKFGGPKVWLCWNYHAHGIALFCVVHWPH